MPGEPTPQNPVAHRALRFLLERQDALRRAVVCEPRGHDAVVGALLAVLADRMPAVRSA